MKVAVVGAGWAGLAAAVRARQAGHDVTVFEAAGVAGGRARSDDDDAATDNGQHLLLGGYDRTLALMGEVGVDPAHALERLPLRMAFPDGAGFALPASGPRALGALRALATARGFSLADKLSVIAMAFDWQRRRFRCAPTLTVARLLGRAPTGRVRRRLIEPLCVAALNTPIAEASAQVFLAVMRDSVFGAPGACDLLLPRLPLAALLPAPALAWLCEHGASIRLRHRITRFERQDGGWRLEPAGDSFDRVILATPAPEAARLAAPHAPAWAACAGALAHEPIATVTLQVPRQAWPSPMMVLDGGPAQFAFRFEDTSEHDRVTLVASAARDWAERGNAALAKAAIAQYRNAFGLRSGAAELLQVRCERRATFRCSAGVIRPPMRIAPGLLAAADFVAGPYPATLEAAVRAGEAAAASLLD